MSFNDLLAEAGKLRGAIRRLGTDGRYLQFPIVAAADGNENAPAAVRRALLARLDPKLGDAARWSRR